MNIYISISIILIYIYINHINNASDSEKNLAARSSWLWLPGSQIVRCCYAGDWDKQGGFQAVGQTIWLQKMGFIVILWNMNVIYSGILMGYTLW